ncbi:hypothetical protein GCM10027404_32640 [Arthrobacter tumbae]|uniref:hypothetical protein n=1 Tax=Arthrobacter tumbae TaxID=163874 RepID=UPI001957405B|nr:hypothetical protein [Arthrobacter tumbae]
MGQIDLEEPYGQAHRVRAQASDETPLIDSGIIYLLAFGQMRFSLDPELKDTETAARQIDARF